MEVSYSCMGSMAKLINSHNKYVASKNDQVNRNLCNCQDPDNCLLDNKSLTYKIVYPGEMITDNQQPSKVYLGISKKEFKTRFSNHKKSFRHWQNDKDTEPFKYIWELNDKHMEYQIR